MDFWFEFFDIHMNKKGPTCHDYHGFKWYNIKISPILTIFRTHLTSFLARFNMTTPPIEVVTIGNNVFFCGHIVSSDDAIKSTLKNEL
jgi:hypothetical protein